MGATIYGPGGTITLDSVTLAALEETKVEVTAPKHADGGVLVHVQNPDGGAGGATETTLAAVLAELGAKLEPADITALGKEVTLGQIFTRLGDIFNAVDGLEVTAGNIEISSGTINLQTDEVEALLRAVRDRLPGTLDVDGGAKVHVQNLPATQPVSGTVAVSNFPAPDEAGLTNAELRATPVPVSGTVGVVEPVTVDGTVAVSGTVPVSGPLTDGQLRATPIPVSFPADEAGLTNAELRATPVPVNGTVTANLGTIDGAATETTLAALLVKLGTDLATRDHPVVPKGFEQITTGAGASALTPPAGSIYAMIQADTPVRYRDDGVDPTNLVGIRIADAPMFYTGSLAALRLIGVAVGAKVNVAYYGRT